MFIVSDEEHGGALDVAACCPDGGSLEKVGAFGEMGRERLAFNESQAKAMIRKNGYYRFHSKTFDPVAEAPLAMP